MTGTRASRLSELFRDSRARSLVIAEINSAGNLHRYLARRSGLRHSEFGSITVDVPSEDPMRLSYADATFGLVVTSDTLEHVPDIDQALRETHRVLVPGGSHVFSVPVIWDRAARRRALLRNGVLEHLLPPSYHGAPGQGKSDFLVFYEFGADLLVRCTSVGYEVSLLHRPTNPAVVTFMAQRRAWARFSYHSSPNRIVPVAHPEQAEFFDRVRASYPAAFEQAGVLEVGSLDINGSVRNLFRDCSYVGVDLALGPGVDLACQGQLVEFPSGHFDTVISAECMEHNPFWRETIANMLRMTRAGGLVLISCATTGRLEHGTKRTNPDASPFTSAQNWDYYRNLTAADLEAALNLRGWLADWGSWTNFITRDLYFVGLRHGDAGQPVRSLDPAMRQALDARYAMTASAKALRRGLKTRLFGDLLARP